MSRYNPIRNPSFVAREYWNDCDDEIVESRDGLYDDFGGDVYHITRDIRLAYGDDGCEPLDLCDEELSDLDDEADEDCNEDFAEDYEYYRSLEDTDMRVAAAVRDALGLQTFFWLQKMAARKPPVPNITEVLYQSKAKLEVEEILRRKRIPPRKHLQTSTYRPSKNARKPFIGSRTLHTSAEENDRVELAVVAVNLTDANGTVRLRVS